MIVQEYVWYWYRTYRRARQRPNTQHSFESVIHYHIEGTKLGQMELTEVRTKDVQKHLVEEKLHGRKDSFGKKGTTGGNELSNHYVQKIRQILIAAFRQATLEGILDRNYAEMTEAFPVKKWNDAPVFTPEVQRKFLQACENHRFYTAYVLFFYLGCRRSELLGLSWNNIDMRRNLVYIRQTLVEINGKLILSKETKTKNSIRTIPIPQEIKYLLQELKKRQEKEARTVPGYHNEHNLVFTNPDGSMHRPAYFSRNFKAMVKKLDFCDDALHLHSARHTWATNMIHIGVPITDVQKIGGWSEPDTLLNIYAHAVKDSERKAMKKLYRELNS